MSEKVKKPVETENNTVEAVEEAPAKKPASKKTTEKPAAKKDNIFKRGHKKVKNWMSEHPGLTMLGGTALGVAGTVAVGEVGRRVSERRTMRQTEYIPQDDQSPLDPNT